MKSAETLFETPLFYHKDIWFRFFNINFQLYLAAKYISGCSEEEKAVLYQEFMNDYPYLEHNSEFLEYCYKIDRRFVLKNIVIPGLQKELDLLSGTSQESIVKAYIEKEEPTFEYKFDENEQFFEFDGGSGIGDILIEDFIRVLPLETCTLYDTLEEYFNISSCEHKALKKYISRIIRPDKKNYEMDLSKEINNPAFYPALEDAGIPEIISQYMGVLKSFIDKHQR